MALEMQIRNLLDWIIRLEGMVNAERMNEAAGENVNKNGEGNHSDQKEGRDYPASCRDEEEFYERTAYKGLEIMAAARLIQRIELGDRINVIFKAGIEVEVERG